MRHVPTTRLRFKALLAALILVVNFALPVAAAETPDCAQISADFRDAIDTVKTDYPRHEDFISASKVEGFMRTTLPLSLPEACVNQVMGDIDNARVGSGDDGYSVSFQIVQHFTVLGISVGIIKYNFRVGFFVANSDALRSIYMKTK